MHHQQVYAMEIPVKEKSFYLVGVKGYPNTQRYVKQHIMAKQYAINLIRMYNSMDGKDNFVYIKRRRK